jgi:hypothetical protein
MPDKARKPYKPRRQYKPTLATALKQAVKAGITVASATIEHGKVTLIFGEPAKDSRNPWDTVLNNHDAKT